MHKLPPLISALTLPCLGLTLLSCFAALPPPRPIVSFPADTGESRQPKPAACNKSRLILLHCQYGSFKRCRQKIGLARTAPEAARWRKNTRGAIRLYNQVADDTDPSAFVLTALPRHLRPM